MGVVKKNYGRKQAWRNEAISKMVEDLANLGQRACKYAIERREYENQKYNLHDSIGSAVYVDGEIVPSSKRYADSKKSTEPYYDRGENATYSMMTGREAIDNYWNEHSRISTDNTIELVCVAATFYAGILEANGVQVISAVVDYLENEMPKYKSYKPKMKAYSDLVAI
jgi:hypothetical protein